MLPVILGVGRALGSLAIRGLLSRVFASNLAKAGAVSFGVGMAVEPKATIEKASHGLEFLLDMVTDDNVNLYSSVSDEDVNKILMGDIDEELKNKLDNDTFYEDLSEKLKALPEEERQRAKINIFKEEFKPVWLENPNSTNITKLYKLMKLIDEGVKGKEGVDLSNVEKRLVSMYVLSKILDGKLDSRDAKKIEETIQSILPIAKQLKDKVEAVHTADNFSSLLFLGSLFSGVGGGALRVLGKAPVLSKVLLGTAGATFLGGAITSTLKAPVLEGKPLKHILSDPETYFNLWGTSWAVSEISKAKEGLTIAKNPLKFIQDRGEAENIKNLEGVSVREFLKNTNSQVEFTNLKRIADVVTTLPEDTAKKIVGSGLKPLQNVLTESVEASKILTEPEKIAVNKALFEGLFKLNYHLEDVSFTNKAVGEFVKQNINDILKIAKGDFTPIQNNKKLKEFFDTIHDTYVVERLKNTLPGAEKVKLVSIDGDYSIDIDLNTTSIKEFLNKAKEFGDKYGSYRVVGAVKEQTEEGVKVVEKGFNVQRYYVPTNDKFILVRGEDDKLYTIPKTYIDKGLIGYTDKYGKFIEVKPKEFIVPTDNIFPYLKKVMISALEKDTEALSKTLKELERVEFSAIKVDKIEDLDKILDRIAKNKGRFEKRLTKLKGDLLKTSHLLLDNTPIQYMKKRSQYGFVKLSELDKDIAIEYLTNKYRNNIAGTSIKTISDVYKFKDYIKRVWGAQLDKKPILKSLSEAIDNYLKTDDTALNKIHKVTSTVGAVNTMLNPAIKIANSINAVMTLKMFMPESFKMLANPDWSKGLKAGVKDWLSVSSKTGADLNKLAMIIDPFSILNEGFVIGLIAKASKHEKFVSEASKLLGVSVDNIETMLKTNPDRLYRLIYHTISGFNTFALPTGALRFGFSKANAFINWYPFIIKPFANSLEMIKSVIFAENPKVMLKNAGRLAGISLVGYYTLGAEGMPVFSPVTTPINIAGQVAGVVALVSDDDAWERFSIEPISFITNKLGFDEAKEYLGDYFKGLGETLLGHVLHSELINQNTEAKEVIQKGADILGFILTHDLADMGIASASAGSFSMDIPLLNLKIITDIAYYFKNMSMGIDVPITYLLNDIAYFNNIGKYMMGSKDTAGWEVEKPITYEKAKEYFGELVGASYVVGVLASIGDLATSGYISKVVYNLTQDPDKDKLAFKTKLNSTRDFTKMEEKWDLYAKGIIKLYGADREGYELFKRRYISINSKLLEKYIKTLANRGEVDYKVKHKIENSLKFLSIIADKIDDPDIEKLYKGYSLLAERLGIYLNEKDRIKLKGAFSGAVYQ